MKGLVKISGARIVNIDQLTPGQIEMLRGACCYSSKAMVLPLIEGYKAEAAGLIKLGLAAQSSRGCALTKAGKVMKASAEAQAREI